MTWITKKNVLACPFWVTWIVYYINLNFDTMQNFMILIREDINRMNELDEADFQAELHLYTNWVEDMSKTGNYLSGDPLRPEGRYLLKDSVLSDGPFIESKEAISGYILIKAKDLDEAVVLGQKCPVFQFGGALEIRPVIKM